MATFMEVIGGIKVETLEFKKEPDDNANIVEIEAQDIREPEENDRKNIFKISEEIIQDQGNKKTYQDDMETMQNKTKMEKDKNEAIPTTLENVQEKLILNFVNDQSQPKKKKIITKNNLRKKPVKIKSPMKGLTTKFSRFRNSEKIYCDEYSLLKDKKYCCNHCKALISSRNNMIKHIRQNHKNKAIFLYKEKSLKNIMETCTSRYVAWYEYNLEDGTRYRCSHCQELFQSQRQVEKHILVKHRLLQPWKKCPLCPFQTCFELTGHMMAKHTDEKNKEYFRCDKCEFKSIHKSGLRSHIFCRHSGMAGTTCDQCQKVLKRKETLRYHMRRFHGAESLKKVKCFHCSYESLSKDALKNHIAVVHTKVEDLKILNCPQCAFNTRYKARFQKHVSSTHRNVFQCHICSYQCSSKGTMDLHLIGHQKKKNDKDLKYRCDHCDYKTYRQYSLQIHKLNHLKAEEIHYFHCYHCKFKAKRKDNLKTHVLRHFKQNEVNFECYMCNFKTKKRQVLLGHIDNHSKKPNEKNLTSEVSRLQHADEAPFGCYLCDYTTVKQHLLVRHIDNHLKEANKRKKLMPKVATLVPVDELTKKRKLDPKEEIEQIEVSGKVDVDQPFKMIPKKMTRSQTKKSGDSGLKNV